MLERRLGICERNDGTAAVKELVFHQCPPVIERIGTTTLNQVTVCATTHHEKLNSPHR